MALIGLTASPLLTPALLYATAVTSGAQRLLDLYPGNGVLAALSFRQLYAAYSGAAVRIWRSSDSAEADIGFDGSGNFDTAAAAAHIGGGTGRIAKWYDQGANAFVFSATNGSSAGPIYSATGMNGLPTMTFSTSCSLQQTSVSSASIPYPETIIMAVCQDDDSMNPSGLFLWYNGTDSNFAILATFNNIFYFDTGTIPTGRMTASQPSGWNSTPHLLELYHSQNSYQGIFIDGTYLSQDLLTPAAPTGTGTFVIGGGVSGQDFGGPVSEIVFWNSDIGNNSDTNPTPRNSARANIKAYWGTP